MNSIVFRLKNLMNHSTSKNFLLMLSSTVIVKVVTFFSIAIIVRTVSVDSYGQYTFYNIINTYLLLIVNFGFDVFFLKKCLVDKYDVSKAIGIQLWSRMLPSIIILLISFSILFFIDTNTNSMLLFLILNLKLIFFAFDITWYYQMKRNFKFISLINFISAALRLILILLFLNHNNIIILAIIDTTIDLITKILLWIKLDVKIKLKVNLKESLNIIKQSIFISAASFMVALYYNSDSFMLGLYNGNEDVAIYNAAYSFMALAILPTNILFSVFSPVLAENVRDKVRHKKYVLITLGFAVIVTIGLFFLSELLISLLFGNKYTDSIEILKLLAFNILPCYLAGAYANTINIWGHHRLYFRIVAVGGIFNIIGNMILIPIMGIKGAVITTILAECLVFLQAYFWMKKHLKE